MEINIEQELINVLLDFLNAKHSEHYTYEAFVNEFKHIEIYAFSKVETTDKTCIIRIVIQKNIEQIFIPNLLMPTFLKHNRIGKKMIRIIYEFGQICGYDVLVAQLTDSFKERLIRRGALETNEFDVLLIVENTNLLDAEK